MCILLERVVSTRADFVRFAVFFIHVLYDTFLMSYAYQAGFVELHNSCLSFFVFWKHVISKMSTPLSLAA